MSFSLNQSSAIDQIIEPQKFSQQNLANYAPIRWLLSVAGWANVVLGVVGVFVPLMPTTVFLIIALWCFSKSSPRLAAWLYTHPKFGPVLQDWHEHRVVPLHAKVLATVFMLTSLVFVIISNTGSTLSVSILAAAIAVVLAYLLSRPHERPHVGEH